MGSAGQWEQERRAVRARVDDIVLLQRSDGGESVLATLTDLSACGMGIGAQGLKSGEVFIVSLAVGESKTVVKCKAVVRYAGGDHFGLEFVDLSDEQMAVLAAATGRVN